MRRLETAALAVIAMSTASVIAIAQTASPSPPAGAKSSQQMSSADCQKVWNEVNPQAKSGVSVSDIQSRVTDVKKVDTNGDNLISSAEFTSACQQGLVKQASAGTGSSTGSSSGTSGSSSGSTGMGTGSDSSPGSSTQPSH